MSTATILKFLSKGCGSLLDLSGLYNSNLYNKYLQEDSFWIDSRNLHSDWANINKDIFNSIIKISLENETLQKKLLDILTKQQNEQAVSGLEDEE